MFTVLFYAQFHMLLRWVKWPKFNKFLLRIATLPTQIGQLWSLRPTFDPLAQNERSLQSEGEKTGKNGRPWLQIDSTQWMNPGDAFYTYTRVNTIVIDISGMYSQTQVCNYAT